MKTKLKNLNSDIKFNQLNMINKILNEIDFVKTGSLGADDNEHMLNEKNSFEGAIGASVYFVGNDTFASGDNGLFKRTEIELRKHLNQNNYQSLCRIYKTACLDNYMCRRQIGAQDLLVTIETPDCFNNNGQNTKTTSFKTKHGLLNVKHNAQESVNGFIHDLYYTVDSSIKDSVFEDQKYNLNDSTKILDFMTGKGSEF